VIGDIAERVAGRVVLFGKRIGEMNGLGLVSCVKVREGCRLTDN